MNQTPTHQALAPEYRLLVLLVSIGFFMQGLDTTIVNTALPAMAASLNEDPLQMHSVVVAYVLAVAACIRQQSTEAQLSCAAASAEGAFAWHGKPSCRSSTEGGLG